MSTLTPNYGLIVPEGTDTLEQVRTDYATNLNTIDANLGGGGGGGGHTIVDENGSTMPTETALQFTGNVSVSDDNVNGRTVVDILGGGGANYGFAIDENNKLFEGTINDFNQSLSYTATEDGIALCWYRGSVGTWQFLIVNGVMLRLGGDGTNTPVSYSVPIRKGDTVSARYQSGSESCYFWLSVYGIKQGTNGIFAPVIYSDTERKIGVWSDNKPLYQRTFSGLSISCPNQGVWYSTGQNYGDIENIVFCEIVDQYGQRISGSAGYMSITPKPIALNLALDNRVVKAFTIQYTKTTDVAGSGNWNTDGVPTVHYSTSEQVIGTWENGKPLYEKVVKNLSIALDGSNWVYYNTPNDIDEVINLECYSDNGGKLLHCAISEYRVSTSNGVQFSGFSGFDRTVNEMIIRYTKTTD